MIEQHSFSGDYTNRYKFNGKELDEETGFYYYGARYYNPKFSIWLSVDPLAEKHPDFNPYVYCADNPVNMIDPDGRDWIWALIDKNTYQPKWRNNVTSKNDKDIGVGNTYIGNSAVVNIDGVNYELNSDGNAYLYTPKEKDIYQRMYEANPNYDGRYSPSTDWRLAAGVCALPVVVAAAEAGLIAAGTSYLYTEATAYVANFSWSTYFGKAATDYSMELFANNGNFSKVNYASVFTAGLGNTKINKFLTNGFSSSIQMNNDGIVVNNFDQTSINFTGGLISNTTDNTFNALQKVYGKKRNVMIQSLNYGMQTVSKTGSNYMSEKFKDKE